MSKVGNRNKITVELPKARNLSVLRPSVFERLGTKKASILNKVLQLKLIELINTCLNRFFYFIYFSFIIFSFVCLFLFAEVGFLKNL